MKCGDIWHLDLTSFVWIKLVAVCLPIYCLIAEVKIERGLTEKIRVYIFNVNDEYIENWEKGLSAIDISDGDAHFLSRYDGDLSAEQQRQVLDFVTQYAEIFACHYNREIDSFTALNMMSIK